MANVYEIKKDGKFIELERTTREGTETIRLREYSEARAESSARMEKRNFPNSKIEVVGPPEYGTQEITL